MLTSSSPGSPTGALQIPSQRTRGCVPNWVAPPKRERGHLHSLLPTGSPGTREPPSSGNPESPEFLKPYPAARWEAPPKFPPEPAARGGRREGGAGTRGRNRDSRSPRVCELGCSTSRTGQLAAAPPSGAWEREPRFPARSRLVRRPARSPGARTPEKKEGARRRTYRALLARAACSPARSPATAAASAPALAGPNSKAPGAGEGARGWEGREGEMQVLQLPPLPTAGRPGDAARGGKRAGANEFTFFFSPARSPSRFSPGPSNLLHRPEFPFLGPGSGRMEEAREEGEKGKVSRRAGRCAREQHPGP